MLLALAEAVECRWPVRTHVLSSWPPRLGIRDDVVEDTRSYGWEGAAEGLAGQRHDEHVLPATILLYESELACVFDENTAAASLCTTSAGRTLSSDVLGARSPRLLVRYHAVDDACARRRYHVAERRTGLRQHEHALPASVLIDESE